MGLKEDQSSGRLEPDGDWLRTADAKIPVAEASPHNDRAHRHNDIRRLAACWNACDGVSLQDLEAMHARFPWRGSECDSPELCAVGKGCAGQFETRKTCAHPAPAAPKLRLLAVQSEAYKPLSLEEVHALSCMQAGAPWEARSLQALAECISIYECLRSQGARPVDAVWSESSSGGAHGG